MEPQTTPNGTNYNLRQRHREKRNLSHSFLSSGSESPTEQQQHHQHHQQQLQQRKRQKSEGRSGDGPVSRTAPYVPATIKARPSIKSKPVPGQFVANERSISGNVPPAFPSRSPTVVAENLPSSDDGNVTSTVAGNNHPPRDAGNSSADNDASSFAASDVSSTRDADVTFLKTAENSSIGSFSTVVNAPDSGVAVPVTTVKDGASTNDGVGGPEPSTPSSHGSAQFLNANSFYGSGSRQRNISPRMGTKVRSPVRFPMASSAAVSLATTPLTARSVGAAPVIAKTTPTRYDHNANSLPTATSSALPSSPVLYGTDRSPISRLAGDFSDEEDVGPRIRRNVAHSRFLGGGEGPGGEGPGGAGPDYAHQQILPPTRRLDSYVIFMIAVFFILLLGSLKQTFFVEDDSGSIETPTDEREPVEMAQKEAEPPAQAYERIKLEVTVAIEETVSKSMSDIRDAWRASSDAHGRNIEETKNGIVAVAERLVSLEAAVEEMRAIERKYDVDLQAYGLEANKAAKARSASDARLGEIDGSVSRLGEIVREITEKSTTLETNLKTAILRCVTEVQALKSLVRVANAPPSINETEIFDKMKRSLDEMRSGIGDELKTVIRRRLSETGDKLVGEFARKSTELENILAEKMRVMVAEQIAASLPEKKDQKCLEKDEARRMIDDAIRTSNRDPEPMVDYALESQGGSVVDEDSSETYVASPSSLTLFGIPVWNRINGPRTVIGADRNPGQCWPMAGSKGHLSIRLSHDIFVTGFSLEHISVKASPTNSVASAPRDFDVEAFLNDAAPGVTFGPFRYDDDGTDPVQYFEMDTKGQHRASLVKLNVHSNYGHPNYTCIYRFRVHGIYAE